MDFRQCANKGLKPASRNSDTKEPSCVRALSSRVTGGPRSLGSISSFLAFFGGLKVLLLSIFLSRAAGSRSASWPVTVLSFPLSRFTQIMVPKRLWRVGACLLYDLSMAASLLMAAASSLALTLCTAFSLTNSLLESTLLMRWKMVSMTTRSSVRKSSPMLEDIVKRARNMSWKEKASMRVDREICSSSSSDLKPGEGLIMAMFLRKYRTSLMMPWSRGVRSPLGRAMDGRATRTAVFRMGAASKLMMARL